MESHKIVKNPLFLSLRTVTWYKNSHSLFDYESNKITTAHHTFPVNSTKSIALYRKRQASEVVALDEKEQPQFDSQDFQFLTKFRVNQQSGNKYLLNFFNDSEISTKEINSQRLNTDESKSANPKQQQTYIIVRKQKDENGEPKGCKLQPGQTIKLGRVEYYVSQVCVDGNLQSPILAGKGRLYANNTIFKYKKQDYLSNVEEKNSCKICLEEADSELDFLFNPCRCAGSCGAVHLNCLLQWISIKVKKQVVGGTLHYNFQKFQCQVCKAELPILIETENGRTIQLLPIQKPKGNYMILQSACQKTKSVLMIKNVPADGIKLGRGHDCQIRITDISVSRNHSLIKFQAGAFYVFDNKSKFGTLVKDQRMEMSLLPDYPQAIQVGRSVVILELKRQSELKEILKTTRHMPQKQQPKNIESKKALDRR